MTKKQKMFCEEYLIDLNATQAAIRAGYSPQTARQIGDENMSKPDIKNAIEKALAERSKRTGVNADRIIYELAKIAFVNLENIILLEKDISKREVNKDDMSAIASVKVKKIPSEHGEIIETEVKTYDKLKALELLGKHLGMFSDRVKVEGKIEANTGKLSGILEQLVPENNNNKKEG